MKRTLKKNYIDQGFGFPVRIGEVSMRWTRGEWIPEIDFFRLQSRLLSQLPFKKSRLTGVEVKFIRSSQGATLTEFGKMIGVSHVAVRKWEARGNDATSMVWANEKLLRITLLAKQDRADQIPDLLDSLRETLPAEGATWSFDECGRAQMRRT